MFGLSVALTACAGRSAQEPQSSADAKEHRQAHAAHDEEGTEARRGSRDRTADVSSRDERDERARVSEVAAGETEEVEAPSVLSQGNDEIDLDLTQRIRKQIVGDDRLSFSAKNVKIITEDGIVTLAGSVKSAAEREEVRQKALAEAGPGRVRDQLEVDE
jgi:osmotically-inducible protein OsmY